MESADRNLVQSLFDREAIIILDVCLLGTGGMMPLPYRWLTSLMARFNGTSILIDCGEGTQIAMKEKGWSPKPIDVMCFTHYHADHISGLPGMLLTMGNAEKTTPLLMIGPKGLARVVNALRVVAPELPFELRYMEITDAEQSFAFDGFRIEAFRVNHNVICYGYNIVSTGKGSFIRRKLRRLDWTEDTGAGSKKGRRSCSRGRHTLPIWSWGRPEKDSK